MSTSSFFAKKSVLITGGTGSFGHAMARKLLTQDACAKVIILSRDEWKQWEMKHSEPIFNHPKIRYFLGDIRDANRLKRAFNEVDVIVHAAALKQVPAAEYNPAEFIKTNIQGGMNIIDMAIDCGVKHVIALSTDKAVNPVNLYGATKLCSDKLFISGNVYVGARKYPKFSVVRYGNVFGTRGSIIPYWKHMIDSGVKALPVTDKRMTRFWITVEEAVDFVMNCFPIMLGGEIFVPKIPSINIIDLAKAMAPKLPIEICGMRAGEKLHELLISSDDSRHTLEAKNYYVILPEVFKSKLKENKNFRSLPEDFAYASDTNKEWLGVDEMKKFVKTLK